MLMEKYQSLIDLANQLGVSGLDVREDDGVLKVDGVAGSAEAKQQLWDEYGRLDPNFRSGDVVMNISAPEGGSSSSSGSGSTYTVQSGDSLSKIGSQYGVSWQKIFEANRDKLDDPDKIQPGQELTIPQG
ncbi:MAG: LysM peptidoglycan-binding domain-containing protein [Acidobacteria bacterium]|jgi:nucleoid-associated protein YgaU|nr:LysM peptidoglycan-binding domain-containing protein [Acidobacteriota bacterium]